MLGFNYFKKKVAIGVEINSKEVRLLKLQCHKSQIFVLDVAASSLPKGTVQDGKIINEFLVVNILKQLVEKTSSYGCVASMSIPEVCVFSKKIFLNKAELLKNNKNICNFFPKIKEPLSYDYVKQANDGEWLLIATRRDELKNYINVLDAADLNVFVVDVDIYAFLKAFNYSIKINQNQNVALLRVDENYLEIIVVCSNEIISRSRVCLEDESLSYGISQNIPPLCDKYIMQKDNNLYRDLNIKVLNPFANIIIKKNLEKRYEDFSKTFSVCLGLALRGLNL